MCTGPPNSSKVGYAAPDRAAALTIDQILDWYWLAVVIDTAPKVVVLIKHILEVKDIAPVHTSQSSIDRRNDLTNAHGIVDLRVAGIQHSRNRVPQQVARSTNGTSTAGVTQGIIERITSKLA